MTAPLVRDVLLLDGSTLRLRTPVPEDPDEIKSFYDRPSEESRYLRFHGHLRTEVVARAYAEANCGDRVAHAEANGGDRVALSVLRGTDPGGSELRPPAGAGAAEVAFAVADDFRDRGTATRMLEQLAAIPAERGVRRLDAEVMATNRPVLAVFERAGFRVTRKRGIRRSHRVARHHPDRRASRADRRARPHRGDGIASGCWCAASRSSRRRI